MWFLAALFGIGTAINAIGKINSGNAAKSLGEFNAQVAEQQAADALIRGKQDEGEFRQTVRTLIGKQRAGFAGQNVVATDGSAVDVQADAAFLGELDALRIRTNAQREAWGYQMEAENARRGGSNAQTASRWEAAGTIAGGGAQVGQVLMAKYGWGSGN